MSQSSFDDLLARWRGGEETAAAAIFQRYVSGLVALASRRLAGAIRQKVDAEDLVQSAFKSFFVRDAIQPYAVDSWDNLWALLATIILRKCGRQVRQFLTDKRNVRREAERAAGGGDSSASWELIAREPTPDEAVALADAVESFLDGLDDRVRPIAELALQGLSAAEIAARTNLTERTVYRQLERIKAKLRQRQDEEP